MLLVYRVIVSAEQGARRNCPIFPSHLLANRVRQLSPAARAYPGVLRTSNTMGFFNKMAAKIQTGMNGATSQPLLHTLL